MPFEKETKKPKREKLVKDVDDLELVSCGKHRDAVIGCQDCEVVRVTRYYRVLV